MTVDLAELCEHLTPTTLAAIVNDLKESGNGLVREVVRQSLVNNVGEDEARELLFDAANDL